jgi:uncharacterized membrane protein YkoI
MVRLGSHQMRGFDKLSSTRARVALLAALGLLIGGSVGGVAIAQGERQEQPPYRSSIQVPDDKNEQGDREEADDERNEKGEAAGGKQAVDEANDPAEQAEAASFSKLARITADQARTAALGRVQGTVASVVLENEDGNLVYGVSVKTAAGERDVKVDAGNGTVLHVGRD